MPDRLYGDDAGPGGLPADAGSAAEYGNVYADIEYRGGTIIDDNSVAVACQIKKEIIKL